MANKIVCFDTSVLSHYLGMNRDDPDWKANYYNARELVKKLKKEYAVIYIPAQVLMEILYKYNDEEEKNKILYQLSKVFRIGAFDGAAAQCGATMLQENDNLHKLKSSDAPRNHIKTDAQIVSVGLKLGASVIYAIDNHFPPIANGRIKIEKLPESNYQTSILDE